MMETQELVVPKSIPMTGPVQRKKRHIALRKYHTGLRSVTLNLPLTFVFMFLATRDRGMRYGTEGERE
jgi:hypothetical protein